MKPNYDHETEALHELTPYQIKVHDELYYDRVGVGKTLEIALTHHSNSLARIDKRHKEMWDDLRDTHNLDPEEVYTIHMIQGFISIYKYKENLEED